MLYFINTVRADFVPVFRHSEVCVAKAKHPFRRSFSPPDHIKGVRLLADLAGELASLDDPQTLQEAVLEYALQMFRCKTGVIFLLDGAGGTARPAAAGNVKGVQPVEILAAEPVRTVVLGERRPLVLPGPGLALSRGETAWHGSAVIPIAGPQGVLGLVVLGDVAPGHALGESDVALMSALGGVAAAALETRLALRDFRLQFGRRMTDLVGELGRTAAELRRIKTFSDDFFESMPFGIIVFDREFEVTFSNAAAGRLWLGERSIIAAVRRTDVARRDTDWEAGLRDVINMQQPWMAEAVTLPLEGGDPPAGRNPSAGEGPLRVNLWCAPLRSGRREVVGGVLIVEDVSQRVQMERRLAVSERLAGVGRLAAMVAHEINNPLDGIIRLVGLARRAEAESGDARCEKYLADAHKGLMRMATVVRDLLEFSRSAQGAAGPMPIRDLLAEAVHALGPAAEQAGVGVSVECGPDVPAIKSGTLYQVVFNLVKNAIEATPAGGRVDVRAQGRADAIAIEVADTGPGIPAEVLARLFEPFYSLKATGKGTGLGLVISKDLVEKQGGTITAANRPQGGALFTVRIPVAPA